MPVIEWFRRISLWEAWSFLILLGLAMPLKYLAGIPEPVRVVGMAHGVLFVAYVLLLAVVARQRGWGLATFALGAIASVLPWGPIIFEKRYLPEEGVPVPEKIES